MADRAASQQVSVLPADQAAVLVITAVQQVAQQGHQDRVLLAAITSALLHTHQVAAGARARLGLMVLGPHLARAAQGLHHQSPDHL
jgi:hypothetical protein